MAFVTLYDESITQRGFYVPRFELVIENAGLPRDVLRDVLQVTYKDDIKEIDSFELVINNWDATTRKFKYVGSETAETLQGSSPDSVRYKLFDPCNKEAMLKLGYLAELQVMMHGSFTTMEPA